MLTKYIKVDNTQPYLALQQFATKIQDAVKEGFVVSLDIKHHARELGFGHYDITLVKPVTSGYAQVGALTPQQTTMTTSATNVLLEGGSFGSGMAGEVENPFAEEASAPAAVVNATASPILAHLDTLKNKQDLLDFATKYGIAIPEEIKIPTAIKKYLKEKVTTTA